MFSLTKCKALMNHSSSNARSGLYLYSTKWMNDLAADTMKFTSGFTGVVFDNNQKVYRTYAITAENEVPTSVMTTNLWLSLQSFTKYLRQTLVFA